MLQGHVTVPGLWAHLVMSSFARRRRGFFGVWRAAEWRMC